MFVWSKWKKIYVFEVRKEENFTWSDVVVERGTKWEMNEEQDDGDDTDNKLSLISLKKKNLKFWE
jgi:hypothetical protein